MMKNDLLDTVILNEMKSQILLIQCQAFEVSLFLMIFNHIFKTNQTTKIIAKIN